MDKDPAFVILTIATGALSLWSLHVLRAIAGKQHAVAGGTRHAAPDAAF